MSSATSPIVMSTMPPAVVIVSLAKVFTDLPLETNATLIYPEPWGQVLEQLSSVPRETRGPWFRDRLLALRYKQPEVDRIVQRITETHPEAELPWVVQPKKHPLKSLDLDWLMSPTLINVALELLAHTPWPLDYIGPAMLTAAGACIGNTRQLRITDLWSERASIWTCLLGKPGSYKTPTINFCVRPLLSLQGKEFKTWEGKRASWDRERSAWEGLPKHMRGSEPKKPPQHKYVMSNFTMERLIPDLLENFRGIFLYRDELLGWILSMNQYKNGTGDDRQNWLSIWSGTDIIIDRKSDDFSAVIPSPYVPILGGMQPEALGKIRSDVEDGLVDRLLYFWPDCASVKVEDVPFPFEIRKVYQRFLEILLQLTPGANEDGEPIALQVRMSTEAFALWSEREWAMKQQAARDDAPASMINALQKAGGQAARVALILHQCQVADGCPIKAFEIDAITMDAAWHIVEVSYAHLRRALDVMAARPSDAMADKAVQWLAKHGGAATVRDFVTAKVAGVRKASEARSLMEDLADRHLATLSMEGAGNHEHLRVSLGKAVEE